MELNLQICLFGKSEATRIWYENLDSVQEKRMFNKSDADPYLFIS